MPILKCKMCGGDLNLEKGSTVIECEYCGTKQTVPTIDDEKKIALFSRANRLRFACEFDKASGIYESIVADFPEEAEAYWGLVLCKYGIEYVDDPATGKKIPTCHRSSFESVMDDNNFEQVLENADPIARSVYREEAKQIEELRRNIIEVSNKEEPYDIFICYKETAENGERTIDSVIAQDVYDELTARGYRVFFSRITLEDRLGQEYEPYIFAALNSARIMLAFGTDYEYYNAVWVKNEWSRFLQLISRGEKKTLIPCYKNIDAYDMPKEFAKLQAQDMGKIGAMQDLLRGIEKLLPRKENQQFTQAQSGKESLIAQPAQSATVDSLLKRAFMYLEDGDWSNAADYCNRVLDISPENAEAYVGLLMTELQVKKEDELAKQKKSFEQNKHFIKAVRFAGEERKKIMEEYSKAVEAYLAEQQDFLLKQAFMYLENGDWINSDNCCNRVLDISPENADAYVGLLMADLMVRTEGELARQNRSFRQNEHFLKSVQFAGAERRKVLEDYNKATEDYIAEQQEKKRLRQLEEKKRQDEKKRLLKKEYRRLQVEEKARWQAEEQAHKQAEEQTERRQSNLCQHCGGAFKGLFTKKCSVCGKPKDY